MKKLIFILTIAALCVGTACVALKQTQKRKPATVGVYYFDGWSGQHRLANNPDEPWAKNAPTHLSRRFVEEFPGREPVWGWRNDDLAIMERQIDLAADNGVDFFLFCWYWFDDGKPINIERILKDEKHTSMELYLKAKNKKRIKFSLLIANHQGFDIKGPENWGAATEFWMRYFKDPQYVTVDGKPLVVLFGSGGIDNEGLAKMHEVAKKGGLKDGLAIAGCGGDRSVRSKSGFTHSTHYNVIPGYSAGSEEHKFAELVKATKDQWIGTEQQPYIPLLTAGWDKRPWETRGRAGGEGWYFPDSDPLQFKNFLTDAIKWMDDNPTKTTKERIVLIYAWNELGEGGYLVPTKEDPQAAKLKMIKSVVQNYK